MLKLRLVVDRFGDMDVVKWWNTNGKLGGYGSTVLRRGFPRTHQFAQSRSVFADAAAYRDACEGRLYAAISELHRTIDGERVINVSLGSYFGGGVETEEQLDAAVDGVREECAKLIGAGKKVIVQ